MEPSTSTTCAKTYPALGRCLYCGSTSQLGKEHIVPFGIGGRWTIPKASCRDCEKITSAFERGCLRRMFGPMRIHLGLSTRRPDERPETLPVWLQYDWGGEWFETEVPIAEHPLLWYLPYLPPPGLVSGSRLVERGARSVWGHWPSGKEGYDAKIEALTRRHGVIGAKVSSGFEPDALRRVVAKIAHCITVMEFGPDRFDLLLRDTILGTSKVPLSHLVGGEGLRERPEGSKLHEISFGHPDLFNPRYLVVGVRLFSNFGAPTYYAVAGQMRD